MATLFKRPGSPHYYARFQHKGEDICFSTRTGNRKEADKAMREKIAQLRGDVSLDITFDGLNTQLEAISDPELRDQKRRQFAERLLQGSSSKVSIVDAWQTWLDNPKKRNSGERTLRSYCGQWNRFERWLAREHEAVIYLHDIRDTMAEGYAAELWKSGVTPRTYNAHITFLRGMFLVLKVQAGLATNVWDGIPNMGKEQESRRPLSTQELKKSFSLARGSMRYWFAIGLYTGLRLGDVVMLKWSEVDLINGFIEKVPMKTRRTNRKVRIPIHPVLLLMLQELQNDSKQRKGYLFPDEAKVYQNDDSSISKMVQTHFADCGIETTEEPSTGQRRTRIVRVGFHSLRHTFVSLCAAKRVPQVAIMEIVGHGSPAMTALYSHAGDEQKAQAIAALPAMTF